MRKKLSLVLTLVLALSLVCGTMAFAQTDTAGAAAVGDTTYGTLQEAIDGAADGDTVELLTDVVENIVVDSDDNITLDLNGCSITGDYGSVITMQGGSLTLEDSAGGGTISADDVPVSGGGVYVEEGSFTMNGGTISGIDADYGGGIYVLGGSFTMNGGTISGNYATYGGGVYVLGGSFTMNGGTISGNDADYGGGIYLFGSTDDESCSAVFEGGTIKDNTAYDCGGGIYIACDTTVRITGTTISGNCADENGGGIYGYGAVSEYPTVKMSGGRISGNSADEYGGGLMFSGQGAVAITGGTLANNTAEERGSDIYMQRADVYDGYKYKLSLTIASSVNSGVIYKANGKGKAIDGWYYDKAGSRYTPTAGGAAYKADVYGTTTLSKLGSSCALVASYSLPKAKQSLKVKTVKKSTVSSKKLKKKKQTVKVIKKVKGAKTKVTYKKVSGSKCLTVNKKNGKVTVKKGTKKGTYKVKIKVTAKSTTKYKKATKTVTVKIKVK